MLLFNLELGLAAAAGLASASSPQDGSPRLSDKLLFILELGLGAATGGESFSSGSGLGSGLESGSGAF